MTSPTRPFLPFRRIYVPAMLGLDVRPLVALARSMGGRPVLLGLVRVPLGKPLSRGAAMARQLRRTLVQMGMEARENRAARTFVSHRPWKDLELQLQGDPTALLLLEHPGHFQAMDADVGEVLARPPCNLAILRGPLPTEPLHILTPMRGGPYAELALRMALSLPSERLQVLHITPPDSDGVADASFAGLARILPRLPEVQVHSATSAEPLNLIRDWAERANLVVMGASAQPAQAQPGIGPLAESMLREYSGAVVIVKTRVEAETPHVFDGVRAGSRAISVLVDKWFAENTYHASEFDDLGRLLELKRARGLSISLAVPSLNEQATVGRVLGTLRRALMVDVPLLDEIVLIDSGSTDRTREIARRMGIPTFIHQNLLPSLGARDGKGEALWKSLLVTHGDLVAWVDSDILNIHPRFVYGLLGPLLLDAHLRLVKGFYRRPLRVGSSTQAAGGGRVTELTARPLLNLLYPELSGLIQPLAGEYAGRREALERLPFFSGYGVETGLLIDMAEQFGVRSIAQVDLLERVHRNQDLEALSKMSFAIIQVVMRRIERRAGSAILEGLNTTMKIIRRNAGGYYLDVEHVAEDDRPPMIEVEEYLQSRKPKTGIVPG